jgi:hypothetical protein
MLWRLTIVAVLMGYSAPLLAEQPSVGDIFDTDVGKTFRGWFLNESGISDSKQSYSVFESNGQEIVVVTTPVVRTSTGGIAVKKIAKVVMVTKSPNEYRLPGQDCNFLGNAPAVVMFNPKTKVARGYFVVDKDIWVRRWLVDEAELCRSDND